MRRLIGRRPAAWALLGTPLLSLLLITPAAWADAPMLAIRLAGGESANYAVIEIERIGFDDPAMLVVVTEGGTDSYPTGSIARIEFLWEFSSIENPEEAAALIDAIHLFQNQPNPFAPETQIRFELPEAGEAELQIFSPDGRLVRTLIERELEAGPHTVQWDGVDAAGRAAPGGVYFYSLRAPGVEESRRMILLP